MTPPVLCLLDGEGRARGASPLGDVETVLGREIIDALGGGTDPSVSRRHGRVFRDGDGWSVEDLASRNGTFVNGRRIEGPARLALGDTIEIGGHRFRFIGSEAELSTQLFDGATLVARREGAPERLRLVLDLTRLSASAARVEDVAREFHHILSRALEPELLAVWGPRGDAPIAGNAAGSPLALEVLRERVLGRAEILRGPALAIPLGRDPQGFLVLVARPARPLSEDDVGFAVTTATLAGDAMRRARAMAALVLPAHDDDIVGESPALIRAKKAIDTVAGYADLSILLLGETGTGKELFARRVHAASGRAGPFVAVNVAALPAELIEGELFGNAKGAFTGAVAARTGYVEHAHGGTLFLDEIGEMPAALQAKLLRVLQDKAITRLGDPRPVAVDLRLVAATNSDLGVKLKSGQFREDLYYRIAGHEVRIPPLRERAEDVALLVHTFMRRSQGRTPIGVRDIAPDALALLVAYRWPGNVRQLEGTVRLAVIHAAADGVDRIEIEHIDERVRSAGGAGGAGGAPASAGFARELADAERQIVVRALAATGGNKREAARQLGWSINTLRERLGRYAIGDAEIEV